MAVRFEVESPQTLIFPFGDFREFPGQHGLQYLYTVQANGDPREKLYATPTLHRELQSAGVAAGTLLTITKLDGTDSRHWRVENGSGKVTDNGQVQERTPQHATAQPGHAEPQMNGGANGNNVDEFTGLEHLLGHCLAASSRVCGHLNGHVQFTSEDIRCLGTTLFHVCNRKQVLPEPLNE